MEKVAKLLGIDKDLREGVKNQGNDIREMRSVMMNSKAGK
jgi:hypothetical protein